MHRESPSSSSAAFLLCGPHQLFMTITSRRTFTFMSTIHCPQSLNHVQAGNSNKADNTAANFSLCGRWNRAFRLHSLRSGKIEVLDFHHQGSAANGDSDVIMWYRACVRGGVTLKGDWSIPPQVLLKISNAHETE